MFRINFLGIPFSGKSYWALFATRLLKEQDISVDYVEEPFKDWAYEGRQTPGIPEQIEGFGIQYRRELSRLSSGVSVVTDSGLATIAVYIALKTPFCVSFFDLCKELQKSYPTLNLLLHPLLPSSEEETVGRWKTLYTDRKSFFDQFVKILDRNGIPYISIPVYKREDAILSHLDSFLKNAVSRPVKAI